MIKIGKDNQKQDVIGFMAGHSVAANLIMLLCLIGGGIALFNVKQEVFPELSIGTVIVTVPYPGASPDEVESGIVSAIEEAVRGIDGVEDVTATASEGMGTVRVEVTSGEDEQTVAQDVESAVDRITTFPEDAEDPSIKVASMKRQVMSLLVYGDVDNKVLHTLSNQIRDDLLQDDNITQVDISGLPRLEIEISVKEEQLRRYSMTIADLANVLRASALDLPAGGLDTDKGEILVRFQERREYGKGFAELPVVTTADGTVVRLRDVAEIKDGFADNDRYVTYDQKPAVELMVYRIGDQTPMDVAGAVRQRLGALRDELPPGIGVDVVNDRSVIFKQRAALLAKNGLIGLVLVFILLGFFLEARLAFWVMMGIPISFLGSFLILPLTGVTVNMISMFAYIIGLGIVVDDAIVVGENVYHYHQEGFSFINAAKKGAREVAMPVTFSILTNVVMFLPLYFVPGTMGQVFRMIPIVVCTVFILSLFESLYVLPAHLAHHSRIEFEESAAGNRWLQALKRSVGSGRLARPRGVFVWLHHRQQEFSHAVRIAIKKFYGPLLNVALRHRYITIACGVAILLVSVGYAASGRMGMQLFPVVASDRSVVNVVLPYGAPLEKTAAVVNRLEKAAGKVVEASGRPELVEAIISDVGTSGSHTARIRVELAPPKIRNEIMGTQEFTNRWRKMSGTVPGVKTMRFRSDSGGPGGRGRPIEVQLSHSNSDVLEQASHEVASALEQYPIATDVDDGVQLGKEQLDFKLKPEGKSLGLTVSDVARQVRHVLYGAEVLRQQRGRDEVWVMVRYPQRARNTLETIETLQVQTPSGAFVPLMEVATYKLGRAYTSIDHKNGRRVLVPSANAKPRSRANEVLADLKKTTLPRLLETYPGLTYSFEGQRADMRESVGSLRVSFLVALLGVYALLAIPFRSYLQPFVVMLSIPFGIVGALAGHLIMGYSLSLMSMFGMVALSGVVVNDSLVLISFANRMRNDDPSLTSFDAVHRAGIQRFRPILLTTLTTFGGLTPMILETERQARFLIPMALSLGFGILFATVITLILIPALYLVAEDIVRLIKLILATALPGKTAFPESEGEGRELVDGKTG